jgi:SnoaL-like domain
MKKLLFSSLIVLSAFASCKEAATEKKEPNNDGYTLQKSENIEYAKKTLINGTKGDWEAYKALYADTAIFYDNATKETVQQNVDAFKAIISKGITVSLDKFDATFEAVDKVPDPEIGTNDYVFIYCTITFAKGDKKVTIPFHQVNALKGGKIVREWDFYDASGIIELMK